MPVPVVVRELGLFLLEFHLEADGSQEWFEVVEEILLRDSGVKVKEIQHLPLHQVDFGQTESEALESSQCGVPCPMLVLGTGVVQVIGRQDQ
jgi:hypothetical protein